MSYINYNQIDKTVKANKLYRFRSELDECEDQERIGNLNIIINTLNSQKDKKQISDEKMQAHFEILKNSQYQKKWQFLSLAQRLNRLQEYIERTEIDDDEYIERLKQGVNENVLRTKDIKFNIIKGCIEEITNTSVLDTLGNKPKSTASANVADTNDVLSSDNKQKKKISSVPTKSSTTCTIKKEEKIVPKPKTVTKVKVPLEIIDRSDDKEVVNTNTIKRVKKEKPQENQPTRRVVKTKELKEK
jgi:hypothetical protein